MRKDKCPANSDKKSKLQILQLPDPRGQKPRLVQLCWIIKFYLCQHQPSGVLYAESSNSILASSLRAVACRQPRPFNRLRWPAIIATKSIICLQLITSPTSNLTPLAFHFAVQTTLLSYVWNHILREAYHSWMNTCVGESHSGKSHIRFGFYSTSTSTIRNTVQLYRLM